MQDRPAIAELVDAVSGFLTEEILPLIAELSR